ncbi:hypothetical protein EN35_12620 [Rhodococcus qingshengii]|nr:hypothetical protein EN35_12620 [Rhodococcus qingshengii]
MIADSSRPGVGDELVTRIVPLENVPARDLAPLLRQMMDAGSVGNVVHYEPSNVLILTGRASTINKLIEVIKAALMSSGTGEAAKLFIWNMRQRKISPRFLIN